MNDDFNTASALSVLFDLAREINRNKIAHPEIATTLAIQLRQLGNLLGILQQDADVFLKQDIPGNKPGNISASDNQTHGGSETKTISDDDINKLIMQRTDARNNKNWKLADQIRDDLLIQGVILEDVSGQTTWRRK
jgi:cysteinyl-tRNA synthetase